MYCRALFSGSVVASQAVQALLAPKHPWEEGARMSDAMYRTYQVEFSNAHFRPPLLLNADPEIQWSAHTTPDWLLQQDAIMAFTDGSQKDHTIGMGVVLTTVAMEVIATASYGAHAYNPDSTDAEWLAKCLAAQVAIHFRVLIHIVADSTAATTAGWTSTPLKHSYAHAVWRALWQEADPTLLLEWWMP